MTNIPISGHVAPGFEAVRETMLANFEQHDEHGAQFCLMREGEVLVDLCAGWSDRRKDEPVAPDTLFSVYSSGKAMAALVIAWLAEEDRLGYEQPIRTIWPEMDNHGKGDLTVAQFMSHQAGLSGITNPDWTPEDWYDWDKVCAELAAQEPIWAPGTACGYHPTTYGILAGEIARRTDQELRTLGRILREELAEPSGADVWIGLPEAEHHRVTTMIKPKKLANLGDLNPATKAAFLMPGSAAGGRSQADWLSAEFAGSNCQATAKGLARLMQIAVDGGIADRAVLSEDTLATLSQSRIKGENLVLPFTLDFAAGIMRNDPNYFYGPNPDTLGHSGWGGSCVFADPKTGLHGAYVMNRQDNSLLGDPRAVALMAATYASAL
ncbi:serine hydrolase domain-containing protein [Litorimonas sp. RW-G-Af-16]|uniref:serine hydrolase domain-containing protein n=1 Tax=Litorimonas sp. RW-G-Af-16 TaxID=3241168 RepID=UPI00390C573A